MSYIKKTEYEIIPTQSFSVIRNCPGCGAKTNYKNTNRFRVNANGNKLDVWLIYQCEKCKHTLNLTVYERQKASTVPKEEYKLFLSNDEELAENYGRNFQFFRKNKADVNEDIAYQIVKTQDVPADPEKTDTGCKETLITIHNPFALKIRPEKQLSEVLGLSRSQVGKMLQQGTITMESISSKNISFCVKTE